MSTRGTEQCGRFFQTRPEPTVKETNFGINSINYNKAVFSTHFCESSDLDAQVDGRILLPLIHKYEGRTESHEQQFFVK